MKFELLPDNRGAEDAVLLDDLRRVAQVLGVDSVGRDKYDELGRFHNKTLVNRFGSWNKALEKAGLTISRAANLTREECRIDLQRVQGQRALIFQ